MEAGIADHDASVADLQQPPRVASRVLDRLRESLEAERKHATSAAPPPTVPTTQDEGRASPATGSPLPSLAQRLMDETSALDERRAALEAGITVRDFGSEVDIKRTQLVLRALVKAMAPDLAGALASDLSIPEVRP